MHPQEKLSKMKELNFKQILVYYDTPEVFLANDSISNNYMCLLAEENDESSLYISTPITPDRLLQFMNGKIDLRSIYTEPEINEIYTFTEIDETINAELLTTSIDENHLPESGFILNKNISNEMMFKEVQEIHNAVIHISLSDSSDRPSIEANDLSDVLKLYQSIITSTHKKEVKRTVHKKSKELMTPENHKLRAFAASYGSFNLHLFSTAQVDPFGNSIIELALSKFQSILDNIDNSENYIGLLRTVKGHTLSSLKKLLNRIVEKEIKLKHSWLSPASSEIQSSTITKDNATKIINLLNQSEDLTEEHRLFKGCFVQVDVEKGTWRLLNEEDQEEYKGEADGKILDGVIVRTQEYTIKCKETIEEFTVSEKENIKYELIEIT